MSPTATRTRPPPGRPPRANPGRPPARPRRPPADTRRSPGARPPSPRGVGRPRYEPTPRRHHPRRPAADRTAAVSLVARVRFIRLVLALALAVLTVRLVQVQVLRAPMYHRMASRQLTTTVPIPALRGDIYDRNGTELAASVPTKDVYVDDYQVTDPRAEARALSPLLHVAVPTLAAELHRPSGYVALAKQVPEAEAAKVAADGFPGVWLVDDARRVYPEGQLARPVLGTVSTANSDRGVSGLEYEYNPEQAGRSGAEKLLESPGGVPLPETPVIDETRPRAGEGLELTLDVPLQYETEQALGAEIASSHALSGTAVVMDVRTGQILSMANLVATARGATQAACGGGSPGAPVVPGVAEAPCNIADDQLYEPGSVFKLVTFSAALQDGLINPDSTFSVPDRITLDGSVFHDAEVHPTETLSATEILAQSSNVGTSEIAQMLGESRLLAQVKDLGFGEPTGMAFPGETPGLLATAAQWEPTDLVSLPIGQVDAVSAQQVLDAYNAVADGGVYVAPKLVRATVGAGGALRATAPSATHRVIAPATDAELNAMLQQVVLVGTGTSAVVPGYTVAGKTGTAQIPTPGKDSYEAGAYMATFVGYAPADHPVLSAIVVLRRPTPIFGGTVAAPVFSQIMRYALHRYDIPTTPGASTHAPAGTTPNSAQAMDIT